MARSRRAPRRRKIGVAQALVALPFIIGSCAVGLGVLFTIGILAETVVTRSIWTSDPELSPQARRLPPGATPVSFKMEGAVMSIDAPAQQLKARLDRADLRPLLVSLDGGSEAEVPAPASAGSTSLRCVRLGAAAWPVGGADWAACYDAAAQCVRFPDAQADCGAGELSLERRIYRLDTAAAAHRDRLSWTNGDLAWRSDDL